MRGLAEYIMRGRRQAIIVALIFTVIPLLGWVADAIVALVTLRKGTKEGALVLMWVILPSAIFAVMGYPALWIYGVLGSSVTTYILALCLRHYQSWAIVIQVGMVLGIIAIIIAHAVVPDLTKIWAKDYALYLKALKESDLRLDIQQMKSAEQLLLSIATGLQVAFLLMSNFFNVAIARWMQSVLYNPGALGPELREVRFGIGAVSIFALIVLGSFAGIRTAIDCLPVVILGFLLAGLSVVHYFIARKQNSVWWLVIFYISLVVFFPYFMGMLVTIALLDCWWDFRRKFVTS